MTGERAATALLHGLGARLWGFPPRLMPVIVARLGPARALAWFAGNMPRYERTLARFGAVRTHLLATAVSLVNRCAYCAHGHGYALELVHLRATGRLFPLPVVAMLALRGRPAAEVREPLAAALTAAALPGEVEWLDRTLRLHADPPARPPGDPDDRRLAHLVAMFATLNGCGIAGCVEPDEAHDPVNRDTALKARHARLRSGA